MSIASEITRISDNIADAYSAANTKGATMPVSQNSDNLATTIATIPTVKDSGGKYLVRVVDYDGTVIKQDHLNTGAVFTLPDAPTHDKLLFQEWATPVDITDNTVTVENQDINIGAVYETKSGLTEFDISVNSSTGLEVYCLMVGNKDWGDGTTNSATVHTYATAGNYTITCDGTTIPTNCFNQNTSASPVQYNYSVIDIRVGKNVTTLEDYCLSGILSLLTITIPKETATLGSNFNATCPARKCIIFHNGITSLNANPIYYANAETAVILPKGLTSIPNYLIQQHQSLVSITIPDSVTTIGNNAFAVTGAGMSHITFPAGLISLGTNVWNSLQPMEFDFTRCTQVPALADTTSLSLSSFNKLSKIKVPTALYSQWVSAQYWSSYAQWIEAA